MPNSNIISKLANHEIPYNGVGEGAISSRTYGVFRREVEKLDDPSPFNSIVDHLIYAGVSGVSPLVGV